MTFLYFHLEQVVQLAGFNERMSFKMSFGTHVKKERERERETEEIYI